MGVTIVNGGQYGDEGKGKIVDYLGERYDIGIRATAGDNAGHTIVVEGKTIKMRLIPSTILNTTHAIIGDDVLVNPETLDREITELNRLGIHCKKKLLVSGNAHLVLPYHTRLDELFEEGDQPIGTTKRGIGPAVADKVNRVGLRMEDCLDLTALKYKIRRRVEEVNVMITAKYGEEHIIGTQALLNRIMPVLSRLQPFIANTVDFIHRALDIDTPILLEGAQGSMNDLTYGSYPYVTSSRPISGGLLAGAGIGPRFIDQVITVIKPYQTRVGIGPVMAEIEGEIAEHICKRGNEFGTVTGRARRVMWLDTVVVNYTRKINGTTAFALTKLDVLDELEEIKLCTGYSKDGQLYRSLPFQADIARCKPIFETLKGWQAKTSHITTYEALPEAAKALIRRIEKLTHTPIAIISVGADRNHTIERNIPLPQHSTVAR